MATGHIRKRAGKNGAVSYQLTIENERDPTTGKRNRVNKTIKGTKKQAEAELRKLIAEMEAGGITTASPIKLGDWLLEFLNTYLPNIEATTRAGYKERINSCVIPYIGNIQLKALKTVHIQNWVNTMKNERNLAPKTIKNAYLNIKSALDKAVILQMIPFNPCAGVELPKAKKYDAEVYDEKEIAQLLNTAKGTDMYLPALLEVTVGMRRGEMLALLWEDIDLKKGIINIHRNKVIAEGKVIIKEPKSEAGKRKVTVGENVLAELKKAHNQYLLDRMEQGAAFVDSGNVIRQPNGEDYRPDSMTQKWERFVKNNHLKHIRLHDLRHTCATAMLASGVDIKTVSKRLGHANVSITLNIYAHSTQAMDESAAQKMDSIVFPAASNL